MVKFDDFLLKVSIFKPLWGAKKDDKRKNNLRLSQTIFQTIYKNVNQQKKMNQKKLCSSFDMFYNNSVLANSTNY